MPVPPKFRKAFDPNGDLLKGRLIVHIQMLADKKSLLLGLTAQGCINETCIFTKPVFNYTIIPGKYTLYTLRSRDDDKKVSDLRIRPSVRPLPIRLPPSRSYTTHTSTSGYEDSRSEENY